MIDNKDAEFELPRFPSLESCLLIDASHKSRNEVIKDIKASSLFDNIVEASSIQDGLKKVSDRSFDACIFGPSISLETVESSVFECKQKRYAKDCAIIVVVRRSQEIEQIPHSHAIVKVPCIKQVFFECVAKGIVIASKGSKWPGVKLSDNGSIMFLEGAEWKELTASSDDFLNEYDNYVLSGDQKSIQKFCNGLHRLPASKVEGIIKTLLKGSETLDDPFVLFFLESIEEWKEEQTYLSLKEASQNLKKRLLSFQEG